MGILGFLMLLLKILGIILLIVSVVILLSVILILFVPIKYKISGGYTEAVLGSAKIKWMFNAISFKIQYRGGKKRYLLKLFGFTVRSSSKKPKASSTEDNVKNDAENIEPKTDSEPPPTETNIEEPIDDTKNINERPPLASLKEESENHKPKETRPKEDEAFHKKIKPKKETPSKPAFLLRIKNFFKRNKKTFEKETDDVKTREDICIEYVLSLPLEGKKELLSRVFLLLKKILKVTLPDDVWIKGNMGLGDPAVTGNILGVTYAISGLSGIRTDIKGDFEKIIINGKAGMSGKLSLSGFVFPVAAFAISKPVRKIIKLYLKG